MAADFQTTNLARLHAWQEYNKAKQSLIAQEKRSTTSPIFSGVNLFYPIIPQMIYLIRI